jgi:phage-related protein
MATLPLLISGSAVQYPFRRSVKQRVTTIAFLDGSEQRCATTSELHEWTIPLALLNEQELDALLTYFEQQAGETGTFSFTDPATGTQYPNCSFAIANFDQTNQAPGQAAASLVIRENPV